MDDLLQVTLQQLASFVNELLGQVARNFLRWQEVLVDSILLHQLQTSTHAHTHHMHKHTHAHTVTAMQWLMAWDKWPCHDSTG